MLGVGGNVRLPDILQVVIVVDGSPTLYLCEYASSRSEAIKEVGSSPRNETITRREDGF